MRHYYRLYDPEHKTSPTLRKHMGCYHIPDPTPETLAHWNSQNWGIFRTVNEFHDAHRQTANLKRVVSWYVDLDIGRKEDMEELIAKGLTPSEVIETASGYHVYYNADGADLDSYAEIESRLLFHYQEFADVRAQDAARILRVPGYYHCKNPDDKFLIKKVFEKEVSYSPRFMLMYYSAPPPKVKDVVAKNRLKKVFGESSDLWEKVYTMDCVDALGRLSGHPAVNGETFSFVKTNEGKYSILVNGVSTACWIDAEGRIGSFSKGGPTIWNWLKWYELTNSEIYKVMREVFPELWT